MEIGWYFVFRALLVRLRISVDGYEDYDTVALAVFGSHLPCDSCTKEEEPPPDGLARRQHAILY